MKRLARSLMGDLPPFRPAPPWLTGDLQTVRNSLRPNPQPLPPDRTLTVSVGEAGAVRVSLNWPPANSGRQALGVLLIHGITGCEDSAYILATARALVADGLVVARVNVRGSGPGLAVGTGPYHAGLTQDLRAVLAALAPVQDRWLTIGFSLGGHMALKLASEPERPESLAAVMSVCAPLDLAATADRMMAPRNALYHRKLVSAMKDQARTWLSAQRHDLLRTIRTVRDFDTAVVCPAFGFRDADDYYRRMSVAPGLSALSCPTFLVHAADDPWIPATGYRRDWQAPGPLDVLLVPGGGHVGFHDRSLAEPWYVLAARHYLDALQTAGVS